MLVMNVPYETKRFVIEQRILKVRRPEAIPYSEMLCGERNSGFSIKSLNELANESAKFPSFSRKPGLSALNLICPHD